MKSQEMLQHDTQCFTETQSRSLQSKQQRFGNDFLQQMLAADIDITGYASPDWSNTREESPEERNSTLAWDRANSVEEELDMLFQSAFPNRRNDLHLQNNGGEIGLQDDARSPEELRRVDISTVLESRQEDPSPKAQSEHSTEWAVRIQASGGAGGLAASAAVLFASLKNLNTGDTAEAVFFCAGVGAGVYTPGASLSGIDEGWSEFQTKIPVTFSDFDGTLATIVSSSAGIGVVNGTLGYLFFPVLSKDPFLPISISGLGAGSLGAEATLLTGVWNLQNTTYSESKSPAPTTIKSSQEINTSVFFEKGSSTISGSEHQKLVSFTNTIQNNL